MENLTWQASRERPPVTSLVLAKDRDCDRLGRFSVVKTTQSDSTRDTSISNEHSREINENFWLDWIFKNDRVALNLEGSLE